MSKFISTASVAFAFLGTFQSACASEVGIGLCDLNGTPIAFERASGEGGQLITTGLAKIGDGTVLTFHYNPFYGIGGTVRLRTDSSDILLLRWDNEFAEPYSRQPIDYKGSLIACRLPTGRP